jgi:thioredoxin reductase
MTKPETASTINGSAAADYDAVVIGGGPAGLTAALYLGRARRRALVADTGKPRNAKAGAAHGVFTRDGTPPGELLAEARRQLRTYPSIELRHIAAESATIVDGGFAVGLEGDETVRARRIILACGVRDELPPIRGLAEHWGTRVFHCSYCHGFEERDRPLAVFARGETALKSVASLLQLSKDVILFTDGPGDLTTVDRKRIEDRARIIESRILKVTGETDALAIHLENNSVVARSALLIATTRHLASKLPSQLGCRLNSPSSITVDANWQTSVPGVYAAGDIATSSSFVAMAAASGAEAAMRLDGALSREDLGIS